MSLLDLHLSPFPESQCLFSTNLKRERTQIVWRVSEWQGKIKKFQMLLSGDKNKQRLLQIEVLSMACVCPIWMVLLAHSYFLEHSFPGSVEKHPHSELSDEWIVSVAASWWVGECRFSIICLYICDGGIKGLSPKYNGLEWFILPCTS